MQCVPRTLRAIASVTWMALSVALIPSSSSFAQSPQEKSAPQSKFADVNGVKLHYLVAGKGDPVVLLHGFAETSHMWRPLIAKLSDKHTVIAPDLRGFGQSSAPEGGYTKKAMAQDIHALVKSLKYDRIRLVGHDIGLMVAYAYAAQYPSEVDRIVLMEACPASANGITSFCCAISGTSTSSARRRWRWSPAASASISNISGTILPPTPRNPSLRPTVNSMPRSMPGPAT
jgi:pimeloyl-ACP methyl ester carboxylesterase